MTADLKALESRFAETDALAAAPADAPAVAPVAPQEPAPQVDPVAELAGVLGLVVGLVKPIFPSLERIYTTDTCNAVAMVTVPVMTKHGWSLSMLTGRYAEEIACAAVVLPVALATYQGITADLTAGKRKANEKPAPAAIQAPAAPGAEALPPVDLTPPEA